MTRFARVLRAAGVKGNAAMTLAAVDASVAVGLERRDDFREALRATLTTRPEDAAVFDAMFARFWASRNRQERLIALLSPTAPSRVPDPSPPPGARRVSEAMAETRRDAPSRERPEIELDARATASREERLRTRDFAQMSAEELTEARRAVAAMRLPDDRLVSRRLVPAHRGRFDLARTQRLSVRAGGYLLVPAFRRARRRVPPLVLLADISGSMGRYSEMMLRFAHALTEHRRHVSTFLFGTALTDVTRALRHRDADEALAACGRAAGDWSGGTRIGEALGRFNRDAARRVLGQGATVLLVTDGLERGDLAELDREAERLSLSCRRLILLSPLLGYAGFSAKAGGVRTLLAHVDGFRPVHSLAAIEELCHALSTPHMRDDDPRRWLARG